MTVVVTLAGEQRDRLADRVRALMRNWHPDPNDSDYRCEFCQRRGYLTRGQHASGCEGEELLEILEHARIVK